MENKTQFFQGVPYRISYRRVKYPRLEFLTGTLHLILPPGYPPQDILERKAQWIHEKYQFIQRAKKLAHQLPTVRRDREDLKRAVLKFVKMAEREIGVHVQQVRLRRMRTKWGSCSRRGTITINTLAYTLPDDLLKYLVYHEVNHLRFWRHDQAFWRNLGKFFKNPSQQEERLALYWFRIQEEGPLKE